MKKRRWIRRVWFQTLLQVSRGRTIHGVDIVVLPPNDELMEKVRVALDLVAQYAPCSLRRLRRYGGILVQGTRRNGAWYRGAAVVKFGERYVASVESAEASGTTVSIVWQAGEGSGAAET